MENTGWLTSDASRTLDLSPNYSPDCDTFRFARESTSILRSCSFEVPFCERGKPRVDIMSIFRGIIVPLMFVISAIFLLYMRTVEVETVSPRLREFAIPAAKYVAATFIGTFGAFAIGVVIAAPLLLYSYVAPTTSGIDLASSLVDRPYFPLPMAVAFGLGYFLSEWLKEGRPAYVWVWPVAQVSIACGCSVTLLEWSIRWPLYPALSFSAAAFLRCAGGRHAASIIP